MQKHGMISVILKHITANTRELLSRVVISDQMIKAELASYTEIMTDTMSYSVGSQILPELEFEVEDPYLMIQISDHIFGLPMSNVITLIKNTSFQKVSSILHQQIIGMLYDKQRAIPYMNPHYMVDHRDSLSDFELDNFQSVIIQDSNGFRWGLPVDAIVGSVVLTKKHVHQDIFPYIDSYASSGFSGVYWDVGKPIFLLQVDRLTEFLRRNALPSWDSYLRPEFNLAVIEEGEEIMEFEQVEYAQEGLTLNIKISQNKTRGNCEFFVDREKQQVDFQERKKLSIYLPRHIKYRQWSKQLSRIGRRIQLIFEISDQLFYSNFAV